MERYDQLVLEASKKFEIILQDYKYYHGASLMEALLLGIGNFGIHSRPDVDHNYQAVIDAVHLKYQRTKDEDVIALFKNGINELLIYININTIYDFCNIISYEMDIEKKGEASFDIGIQQYLDIFSDELFIKHDDLIGADENIDKWLHDEAKFYREKYGYELNLLEEYPTGVWEELNRKLEIKLYEKMNNALQHYKKDGCLFEIVNLLMGNGDYKISVYDRYPHCYSEVIEYVHKLYETNKDEDILKMYESGVIAILDNVSLDSLRHFYNVIGTESEYERENSFSFRLNGKEILKVFEEAISSKLLGIINSNPYWRDVAKNIRLLLSQM